MLMKFSWPAFSTEPTLAAMSFSTFSLSTYFLGMATCAGLIIAIGAQNAFILRQGIRREHVGAVVAVCTLSDVLLIALGTAGIGLVSDRLPMVVPIITVAGILFLSVYGWQAARRAWQPAASGLTSREDAAPVGRGRVMLQAAAFSWLNPHAWLDTTVLIGSLANAQGADGRWAFAAGAASSSLLWFTLLAWAAGRLAPLFRRPQTWRVFDASVALMMMGLAGGLTMRSLHP